MVQGGNGAVSVEDQYKSYKNIKCEEPLVALEKDDHHYESTRPSVQLPRGSETEGHPAWAA